MQGELKGKRVLVTGGSMGIGLEVSRRLARQGARVVIAGRSREALDSAASSLEGTDHFALSLDVSDATAWSEAMAVIDREGELHGLVAAAGVIGPIGTLANVSMDEFATTIAVNLVGTALALHHALPRLAARSGRAVTFSGGGGTSPLARYDAYAASKAGVIRLTENVAADGVIEVNCVSPGFVATRMHEKTLTVGPAAAGPEYYRRTRAQLEKGGFAAAEAAELVAFLLGDSARGITGRLISAEWDAWRDESWLGRLREDPAIARLRRIDDQFYARIPPR